MANPTRRLFRGTDHAAAGIIHPPPPMLVAAAYEWFARGDTVLDADLRVHQLEMPGHGRHRLRARPWLSLELAGDGRFEAT